MKRAVSFALIMLVPFLIIGQVKSLTNPNPGNNGDNTMAPTSIPPGLLLWDQGIPPSPANGWTNQEGDLFFKNLAADDFTLSSNYAITGFKWYQMYLLNRPANYNWKIEIYDNADCTPTSVVHHWNVHLSESHEEYIFNWAIDKPVFSYWASLSPVFLPRPGETYWIGVRGMYSQSHGQCFWMYDDTPFPGCELVTKDAIFETHWNHQPHWFCFQLYGGQPRIPLSNWALGIGIFLIVAATLFRVRRYF